MVKAGYAWLTLEESARQNKIGLWKEKLVPPWDYRKRKKLK